MPRSAGPVEDGLVHVVVCGGTPGEWSGMSPEDWRERFETIARGVEEVGTRWVTVFPHHGTEPSQGATRSALGRTEGVEQVEGGGSVRHVWSRGPGVSVVVDTEPDGHVRFARVVEALRSTCPGFDEDELSRALSFPVGVQPDLVLILGPPDELPSSLVWELAYSELVFLDIAWKDLKAVHLEMAIDDFNRRHRRFGGLDS